MIGFQTSINNELSLLEELKFAMEHKIPVFDIFFDRWLPSDITEEEFALIHKIQVEESLFFTVHLPIEYHSLSNSEKKSFFDFLNDIKPKTTTVHFDKITIDELQTLYNAVNSVTKISIENTIPDTNCENYLKYLEKAKSVGTIYATIDAGHGFVNGIEAHILAEKIVTLGVEIATFHAHDNDGKRDMHLPVGEGTIKFDKLFAELKKQNVNPYIVIEHWDNNLKSYKNLRTLKDNA